MSGMTKSLLRAPSRSTATTRRSKPSRHMNVNDAPRLDVPLALICETCGTKAKYDVGTVVVDPRIARSKFNDADDIEQSIGFSGYFHCTKCKAGGPWRLPDATFAFITILLKDFLDGFEDVPLIFGCSATFDKHTFRYATECEAHLKGLIEKEPERGFLWVRLGNLYTHAGQNQLAEPAYHRALQLDPVDIEAHAMLGHVLVETDRALEAVSHWHAVLKNVREARQVNRDLRRKLARSAIECLLDAHARSKGKFDLFPTPDPAELVKDDSGKPAVVEIREFDLGSDRGIDELCDVFVDPPRSRWRDMFGHRKKRAIAESDDWAVAPIHRDESNVPRNHPCPCGSGHKYKKCCGALSRAE